MQSFILRRFATQVALHVPHPLPPLRSSIYYRDPSEADSPVCSEAQPPQYLDVHSLQQSSLPPVLVWPSCQPRQSPVTLGTLLDLRTPPRRHRAAGAAALAKVRALEATVHHPSLSPQPLCPTPAGADRCLLHQRRKGMKGWAAYMTGPAPFTVSAQNRSVKRLQIRCLHPSTHTTLR